MPKKSTTKNQFVTSQEFNESKKEFIARFDKIENKMATKDDMVRLSKEIIKNSEDIQNIKETMATKDDVRQILTAIDSFAGKNKDHERKAILNTERINELEPKVENLENRVTSLELHSTAK